MFDRGDRPVAASDPAHCLLRFRPRPEAPFRLVCFGPAGSGASFFRKWPDAVPPDVDVLAVQMPGRETRLAEPPRLDLAASGREVAEALAALPPRDTLLFGHSMGALVALEAAAHLLERPCGHALRLAVSGREAPDLALEDPGFTALPDADLLEAVAHRYGGIPRAVIEEEELRELFAPVLRADFAAVLAYDGARPRPLDIGLEVLRGLDDPQTRDERLVGWRRVSARPVTVRDFPGGHFFLVDHRAAVVSHLVRGFEDAALRHAG